MDFIIKSMQLSIERFIDQPERNKNNPTRAAIFIDLTNMINSVSREELFDIIQEDFPELNELTSLLYTDFGDVYYKWNQTEWRTLQMKEEVNQGCPLSPVFATLVLHRVLQPLAEQLKKQAETCLANGDIRDDGHGSLAHLFAYMDDISSTVHHEDIKFFCTELDKLGAPRGCFVNPQKTRILTSCSGGSVLPRIRQHNPQVSQEIENTIATYSIKIDKTNNSTPVELTDGFRLLGSPVGSAAFAEQFFTEQIEQVDTTLDLLMKNLTDDHTKLKLFSQSVINKLPHLLDADVMHNYPIYQESGKLWHNWNGSLIKGINNITKKFFNKLLHLKEDDSLPQYATLIANLNLNKGGLGILNASLQAAPDFVINTMICKRRSNQGFSFNKDIVTILPHQTISDLYNEDLNSDSSILQCYKELLKNIGPLCCPKSSHPDDRINMFMTRISTNSARDRIKTHCGQLITGQIYTEVNTNAPEHYLLLPSILSPQTSYPLVGMNRSKEQNRLPNWTTQIAMRRKLRLPIYDPNNVPICKCRKAFDCWADHSFNCKRISKKTAHDIIRDSWAKALQAPLATAGYIRPNTKIEIEKTNVPTRDISARPFDISFEPDIPISVTDELTPCPFATIGADITITNSAKPFSYDSSDHAITSVMAFADKHIQKFERRKYMRKHKPEKTLDPPTKINGDDVISDIYNNNMVLLPFAIDPHGRWGQITENFLTRTTTSQLEYKFRKTRPYAQRMFARATTSPSPNGILRSADSRWKQNKTRTFYGHSYTAPTPSITTIQQLGLGITKAFATHIRNANMKECAAPEHNPESDISRSGDTHR